MHEFTDGCAAQYKSRHCIGDLSCCRLSCETTSLAPVIHGTADITNAKQLCDHLTGNFSKPTQSSFPSPSTAMSLKRRLLFDVPAEGEEAVSCYREGRRFNTIKGIRKLYSVITSLQQLKVHIRQRCCYCSECLYENYPDCKNKEYVDDFREVKLEREASAAVTRPQADQTLASPPSCC